MSPSEKTLRIEDLNVQLRRGSGWSDIVSDVSLTLEPGKVTAIVGESGSGKSVTALATIGLLQPGVLRVAGGSIRLGDLELVGASPAAMRRVRGAEIAMVFQEPMTSLNPVFTVGRQIADVVLAHRGDSKSDAMARAKECLDLVGIPVKRIDAYPHELSGGMRQRVLIAMAIACEPALLIADEPTTALDVTVQAQIIDLLGGMVDELGMSMLFISHDFGVVADVADHVHVMYKGKVVESGPVLDMFDQPRHPYTQSLMHLAKGDWLSQPHVGQASGHTAHGSWNGCHYAPRCPYAIEACVETTPELRPAESGAVRCVRADDLELVPVGPVPTPGG